MTVMEALCACTRLLPVAMDATGKRPPAVSLALQHLVPLPARVRLPGGLVADTTQPAELVLSYFFHNVLRYYRSSPLYAFMRERLRPGTVFVDVGAHLGLYSYLARGLGADVILVEPDPAHYRFLRRNRRSLGPVFGCAAAATSGIATFYRGRPDNTGGGSLVASLNGWEQSGYAERTTVRTARLEDLVGPDVWPRVALVKIDVEGAEADAVRGLGDALARHAFDIWCEVRDDSSDRNPGSYREVCALAAPAGLSPFLFDGHRFEAFVPELARRVFDVVLTRRAPDSAGLAAG